MMKLTFFHWSVRISCLLLCSFFLFNSYAHTTIDNPCSGNPVSLLNLVDRPTIANSPCVVPFKDVVIESGYQYQELINPGGNLQNGPNFMLRFGLPANYEFLFLLPNYIHRSLPKASGFSSTAFGIKHEFGYTKHWIFSAEGFVIPSGGSAAFGTEGVSATLNAIINYTFNSEWSILFMLGESTITQSRLDGGKRFESFNPDVVLSYAITPKLIALGEIYGQTKTYPNQGSGFNSLFGLSYLITPTVVLDLEVDQRISGQFGDIEHYIGAGISILFG